MTDSIHTPGDEVTEPRRGSMASRIWSPSVLRRVLDFISSGGLSAFLARRKSACVVEVEVRFIDPDAVAGGDPNPKVERHYCSVPESALWAFLDEWEGQ